MTVELLPLPLPSTADASIFTTFGREHDALLFRNANLSAEQQYALTKAFDPNSEIYGHGNNKTEGAEKSILHPYLKTIPRIPQVQVIGNGKIYDHEGLAEATLKHSTHKTFHKTTVSPGDEAKGITRFYRWHMDAALYDLSPPHVTTLYGLTVPSGPKQLVRYDDGTGDELPVTLAATAFVSGKTMFNILPEKLKSVAVRAAVKYAPHPYEWMAPAHAKSNALGMESEGLEVPFEELPAWEEGKIKTFPMLWKNPITKELSFQVHPCGAAEIFIDSIPEGVAHRENSLYPDGAHITDLQEVRDILYRMQRPGIAPELVYPHAWQPKDLVLFHNRGVLHTVVGTLKPEDIRVFHQCNLAASDDPSGPTKEDIERFT